MAGYGRIRDEEVIEGLELGFLKRTGVWEIFNHYRETGKRNRLFKAFMVVHVLILIPELFSAIGGPFAIEKSLEGLTVILLGPMTSIQRISKFTFFWIEIEFCTRMMELLKRDFYKCIPNTMLSDAEQILRKAARRANFLGSAAVFANFGVIILLALVPILRSEFFRCTLGITLFGKAKGHNQILQFWYPVDTDATPWTQIIYGYELILTIWAASIISLFEILLLQFVVLLGGHLEVLQLLLSQLKKDQNGATLPEKIYEYIREHQKTMKLENEMRKKLNLLVSLIIICGFMVLIFTIFNFFLGSAKGDWIDSVKFIIYMFYALVETCVYCHASSELEYISEQVCFGAYSSEWYEMDQNSKKAMQMVIMRSRKRAGLRAGWQPVNFQLLSNILQTAYSTSMLMLKTTTDSAN